MQTICNLPESILAIHWYDLKTHGDEAQRAVLMINCIKGFL